MQDGATRQTAEKRIRAIHGVFGELNGEDIIIGKGFWPPRSLDLNPCDFNLWWKLKNFAYANNLHDVEALEQNISEAIYNIQQRELQQVSRSLFKQKKNSDTPHRSRQKFWTSSMIINYYIWLINERRSNVC
jgi:hypothetical protein